MNLSDIIHEVWKDKRVRELRIRKDEVKVVVSVAFEKVLEGILKYGQVKIMNLFTLKVKKISGRRIRHLQTGEEMYSKDYHRVKIEPSKKLKDGLEEYKN